MATIAELVADKFAASLRGRVTPTQNMVLNAIKGEAVKRNAREYLARKRREQREKRG